MTSTITPQSDGTGRGGATSRGGALARLFGWSRAAQTELPSQSSPSHREDSTFHPRYDYSEPTTSLVSRWG